MKVPRTEQDYGSLACVDERYSKIAEQYSRYSADSSFVLNMLVAGRRGSGASTLVNALFSAPLVTKNRPSKFTTTVNEIVEDGVRLRVAITTYHENDFEAVNKFIRQKNEEYYEQEQGLTVKIEDRRIHVCLYLVPMDSIQPAEVEGVKQLSKVCNLIPIISKADSYTVDELRQKKEDVFRMITDNDISVYQYSCFETGAPSASAGGRPPDRTDASEKSGSAEAATSIAGDRLADLRMAENRRADPSGSALVASNLIATVASEKSYDLQGNIIRGRRYLWGFIDIYNEAFSDFRRLQRILLEKCYEDFLWKTDVEYYNEHRKNRPTEDAQVKEQAMKRRLCNLQSQLDEVISRKHKAIIEELRREERSIEKGPECQSSDRSSKDILQDITRETVSPAIGGAETRLQSTQSKASEKGSKAGEKGSKAGEKEPSSSTIKVGTSDSRPAISDSSKAAGAEHKDGEPGDAALPAASSGLVTKTVNPSSRGNGDKSGGEDTSGKKPPGGTRADDSSDDEVL